MGLVIQDHIVYNGNMKFNTRDKMGRFELRHGLSSHPLYSTWHLMVKRCHDKNNQFYYRYGGRGIKVCDRWLDVTNFIDDITSTLGDKPSKIYSLDRVDNDSGYSIDNVRWASPKEQANNRRTPKTNTSGYEGVNYDTSMKLWQARITVNGIRIRVGRYKEKQDAVKALEEYKHEV